MFAILAFVRYLEFKRQLGKAGITSKEFARLVRLSANSITNYAATGDIPSHLAIIAVLMGEMAEAGLNFRSAVENLDISMGKPRGSASKGKFGGSKQEVLDFQRISK